jgi:hypothetical protein
VKAGGKPRESILEHESDEAFTVPAVIRFKVEKPLLFNQGGPAVKPSLSRHAQGRFFITAFLVLAMPKFADGWRNTSLPTGLP